MMGATARVYTIPAPVKGWNARDQVDQLEETEAAVLDNFVPQRNRVEVRGGVQVFSRVGGGDPVGAGFEFSSGGTRKMIVAAGAQIGTVTDGGVYTALSSSFTSSDWSGLMMGANLLLFNGADTPQKYDGTTLSNNTLTGSGLTATNIVAAIHHRTRLYAWESAQPWFWYGGTSAISGVLNKFDLTYIGRQGGNVVWIESLTVDAGDGVNDLIVIAMSSGDYIVYAGSNPGDSSNWSLVGVYPLAPPVNRRAVTKLAGDIIALTIDGAVSLNQTLPVGRTQQSRALSDRISGAFLSAVQSYGANDGWKVMHYPRGSLLIFVIPRVFPSSGDVTTDLYVMNTDTQAWTRFTNLKVRALWLYKDRLYFGGPVDGAAWNEAIWNESPWSKGLVLRYDETSPADIELDQYGATLASTIQVDARPGYSQMSRSRVQQKRWTMARPIMETDADLAINVALAVDYDDAEPLSQIVAGSSGTDASWGEAVWNVTPWAGGLTTYRNWISVAGVGYSAALNVRAVVKNQTLVWRSTDFAYEPGGGVL